MNPIFRSALLLLDIVQPSSPTVSVRLIRGRCVGCDRSLELNRFQFVTPLEGWATGFYIVVSHEHGSQSSIVLHTINGGKTWTLVPDIETYGLDVEPAFSFINRQAGWIGWTTASEPMDHLIRTTNGGRGWIRLENETPGSLVHLRFFDSSLGYAAISTMYGPQFGVTRNGGKSWAFRKELQEAKISYPDVMPFLNPQVGWIGGSTSYNAGLRPRLVRTIDGGDTWQQAAFPPSVRGNPHDIFFLDADRGWMVLWNSNPTALLQTMDGGRTWTEDNSWNTPEKNLFLHAVRYLSTKVGLLFVQETSSTDIGTGDAKSDSAVLATFDEGHTWSRHSLPAPIQSCEVVGNEVWCSSGMDIVRIRVGP
jgi:photosystem II stability/assembly factor-like uncharacterized protein